MIQVTCLQVRALMDQRAQGLSDADRLRVESHTARCTACADHSATLSSLVALAQSAPSALSDAARQRVIARALSAPVLEGRPSLAAAHLAAAHEVRWPRWALAGAVAAALVVGVVALPTNTPPAPVASAPASNIASVPANVGASAESAVQRMETDTARRVEIAGAVLQLSANTAVEWDPRAARVTLQRGTVRAVVAPRVGQAPFSVRTPAFDVVVVGTDFEVTLQGVTVYEGVVRVQDHQGRMLREALHAGEAWSHEPVTEVTATESASAPARTQGRTSTPSVGAAPQWIAEARTLLASGDVARARKELDRAERSTLTITQRLEVITLVAESYQVAGMNRRAIEHYDRVRKLDATSSAADNADFAAARLTLSSGDRAGATSRFERYLQAHPTGRFRVEVERVLATLRNAPQANTRSAP